MASAGAAARPMPSTARCAWLLSCCPGAGCCCCWMSRCLCTHQKQQQIQAPVLLYFGNRLESCWESIYLEAEQVGVLLCLVHGQVLTQTQPLQEVLVNPCSDDCGGLRAFPPCLHVHCSGQVSCCTATWLKLSQHQSARVRKACICPGEQSPPTTAVAEQLRPRVQGWLPIRPPEWHLLQHAGILC